jgi:hypothetical protein
MILMDDNSAQKWNKHDNHVVKPGEILTTGSLKIHNRNRLRIGRYPRMKCNLQKIVNVIWNENLA